MNELTRFEIREHGQKRANESKSKILEAAAMAFSDSPYESVTIREIARNAAVKHQLIAYYFGNKETLWNRVVTYLYAEFSEVGSLIFSESESSPEDQLRAHLQDMMEYSNRKPELFRIVMKEMVNPGPRLDTIKSHMLHFAEISFQVFDKCRKYGYFQNIRNEELYFIISGAMTQRILFPEMNRLITGDLLTKKKIEVYIDSLMKLLIGAT